MFFAVSVLYFHKIIGLTLAEVGLGLTLAGLCGLCGNLPLGRLADRWGPRSLLVALTLVQAVAVAGYLVVDSFAAFLVTACCVAICQHGSRGVQQALVASVVPSDERVHTRARLQVMANVGVSAGGGGAAVALTIGTPAAYQALVAGAATVTVVAGLTLARLKPGTARPAVRKPTRGWEVLRDRRYVVVALLCAVQDLHMGILQIGVPLWIVERSSAPSGLVGVLVVINTVCVVLFQVRASRGTDDTSRAAVSLRRSGLLLACACLLYASAAAGGAIIAIVLFTTGALAHAAGELLHSAGQWGLSFTLAPDHAQGQYQGLFTTGTSLAVVLAPLVLTTILMDWGTTGWLVIGAAFVASGFAVPPVVRGARNPSRTSVND
nr:putative membrane protein [Kibdelosporangium sp. MJ126-NF4]CTQ90589.1 putative membrane protein [Kibdelosporangium sp. MJ126-NF4]